MATKRRLQRNARNGEPPAKKPKVSLGSQWLIPMMDEVFQLVKGYDSIELPKIVVVGDQSSGKTSLVEALVGIHNLLPQGNGFVTKRPLRLQLVHTEESECNFKENDFLFFWEQEKTPITLDRLRSQIHNENQKVTEQEITVTIKSPKVTTLTIVDTPGIIANMDSDENHAYVGQFKKIVRKEIEGTLPIILFVHKAGSDHHVSITNGIIRNQYERTIAVLTHADCPDAKKSLKNSFSAFHRARLGRFIVMNNQEILKEESEFEWFTRSIAKELQPHCGVDRLRNHCATLLQEAIARSLPSITDKMNQDLTAAKRQLEELEYSGSNPYVEFAKIFSKKYSTAIQQTIAPVDKPSVYSKGLIESCKKLEESISKIPLPVCKNLEDYRTFQYDINIGTSRNCLIREFLQQLEAPMLETLSDMFNQTCSLIKSFCIAKYPALQEYLQDSLIAILSSCRENTRQILHTIVEQECSFINLRVIENNIRQLPAAADSGVINSFFRFGSGKGSSPKSKEEEVTITAQTYCRIISAQITDQTIKTVFYNLLKQSSERIEPEIVDYKLSEAQMKNLLQQDRRTFSQIAKLKEKISKLDSALAFLQKNFPNAPLAPKSTPVIELF